MILDKKIIGKRIKKIRHENGLTQSELAEMCNLSTSYISCIETGKKRPSLKSLEKFGKSLHVKVESFWVVNLENVPRECESNLIQIFRDFNSNQKQMLFEIALLIKKIS
ncbi:MAG: helix-turn-helix transcriptional regulator [bacterium]